MSNTLIEALRTYLEGAVSPGTAQTYLRDATAFVAFCGDDLHAIGKSKIRAWLLQGQEDGMGKVTQGRKLTAIAALYRSAGVKAPVMARPKVDRKIPHTLSPADAAIVVSEIGGTQNTSERDAALVALLYGAGLRIGEALALNISDVTADAVTVGTSDGKRTIPLMAAVRAALDALLATHTGEGALFVGSRGKRLDSAVAAKVLRDFRRRNGLPEHVTARTLRHSFTTHMLAGGADVRSLQELLGHASLVTTNRYASIGTDDLVAAFNQSHGRA